MTRLAAIARRHRFGHAILFALTVCLLVGTAAVDPLLTRSFSHAVVSFHADAEGVIGSQVQITANGAGATTPAEFEQRVSVPRLEKLLDPRVKAVVGAPIVSRFGTTQWLQATVPVTVRSSEGQCEHVKLLQGHCPTALGQVLVSEATLRQASNGLHLGSVVTLGDDIKGALKGQIVGVYTMSAKDPFWGGVDITAFDERSITSAATLLATVETVQRTVSLTASVSYPVRASALTPATLARTAAGGQAMAKSNSSTVFESLSQVYASTKSDVHQVGRILPYLLLQLGLVLLILLVQVTSFCATVRRGEAAVLKMRGNGTAGVVRFGAREFLPAYLVGAVGGVGLAYVVDGLVRHVWLPGSVGASWNWTSLWVAVATSLLIAMVWLLCWWLTARESISALLRSRPQRRRGGQLSMPAAVLGVVCLVGVILTATRNLTGAPVQVTPVLLAGLVAIIVGVLLAPLTARLVRRLLSRRNAAGGLAVAQLGRRAGVVTAASTLIITSALLTLSVSVVARGGANREARAAADVGAQALVDVTVGEARTTPESLLQAVHSVDPQHRQFSPVVGINASSPQGLSTLGVIPADLARIGVRTGLKQPVPWSALEGGGSASAPSALVSTWSMKSARGSTVTAPTMADVDGSFRVAGTAPYIPGVGARTIVVDLPTMLKAGNRPDNLFYQVFSSTQDPKRLAALTAAVQRAGFGGTDVQTLDKTRAGYDATATAWAMNLSIVVSVLSVFAALTSVVLVALASRDDRRRDLRALRTGGVPHAVLRRATVGEFVLLALVGSVIGALTAPVAAWLTGRSMLWWSDPPAMPVTRTGFQWAAGSTAAVCLAALLVLVAAAFGTRLAAKSSQRKGFGV
ncbi:FtsX-like permease family protein [Flexivirga alba]|uniref:FtsX-like permease family protein n=1 Tax=Flexivirga alba TaxID=702742 RepID=A0ABW2ABS3_9MICO